MVICAQMTDIELDFPAVNPEPAMPSVEEVEADLRAALPMLITMRSRMETIDFSAPASSGLPTEEVHIRWYGFSILDDPNLGVWKFAQDGHPTAYITSLPGGKNGPEMAFHSRMNRERQFPEGELDSERLLECDGLLRIATRAFAEYEAAHRATVQPQKHRRLGRMGLHRHATRNA